MIIPPLMGCLWHACSIQDETERELMRVKQLLENERKAVEQKNEDIAALREQIDAIQLKSTEEKTALQRVKVVI